MVDNNFVLNEEPPTSEEDALDQNYLIKFIVTGAFYPNYFSTVPIDRNQVTRDLNGKNERTTVQVSCCFYIYQNFLHRSKIASKF
jgi:hypothetical protein